MCNDESREDPYVSIPRGGPLYVPNMIGPVTRVPDFETSVFQELQSLRDALSADSPETWDDEILVDELKIITEDELVDKAFEIAFTLQGDDLAVDVPQVGEERLSPRRRDDSVLPRSDACLQISESDMKAMVPVECLNLSPLKACDDNKSNKKFSRKRKRNSKKNNNVDKCYMAKVEELARFKQKQEEFVRLHSYKSHECGAITEKSEKIRSLKSASVSTKVRSSNTCDYIATGYPETTLCFEIYHNKKQWLKTQEFLVLGRQFLTEVKDKINCSTDDVMRKAGHYDPSGYFLIEDVFCNDMRAHYSIDYSKPILDWLKNSKKDALEKWESIVAGELKQKQKACLESHKKQQLPRFKAVHMHTTRFCDIRFRLGAGYLYCHQGDCKHVIVIRDMRLIHPEDVQNRAAYPLVTYETKLRYMKCSVCNIYRAQKMTVDDKWAPQNPCYFCDVCYYMLHYENGSLLYSDFSVYDYQHE